MAGIGEFSFTVIPWDDLILCHHRSDSACFEIAVELGLYLAGGHVLCLLCFVFVGSPVGLSRRMGSLCFPGVEPCDILWVSPSLRVSPLTV